jgi:hypothetical protein
MNDCQQREDKRAAIKKRAESCGMVGGLPFSCKYVAPFFIAYQQSFQEVGN